MHVGLLPVLWSGSSGMCLDPVSLLMECLLLGSCSQGSCAALLHPGITGIGTPVGQQIRQLALMHTCFFQDYIKAVSSFKLNDAFPNMDSHPYDWRVDPYESQRVWFTVRSTATHTGPLHFAAATYKATGKVQIRYVTISANSITCMRKDLGSRA